MKLSLILPTIERPKQLDIFLKSVIKSENGFAEIEIIIIDQSTSLAVKQICLLNKESPNYKIIYIKSNVLGLSVNRNIGLQISTGDIIGFPDDDCSYYSDTLDYLADFFLNPANAAYDGLIGQIYDKNNNKPLIKNWPQLNLQVSQFNFYHLSSSITFFCKKNHLKFNEFLGVGAKFGSCEDVDFIYKMLLEGKNIYYTEDIKVWHPTPDFYNIPLKKVESYASGLGYFIINEMSLIKVVLLISCLLTKGKQAIFSKEIYCKGYFRFYLKGLIRGLKSN